MPAVTQPRSPSKKTWLWALLALLITTGGIFLWRSISGSQTEAPPANAQQGPPPRPVELVQLSAGRGLRTVELVGQVQSSEQATVRAQTAGVLQDVRVQPGDRVEPGMTIAILDDADQQLALAEAEARLAEERSNLARLEVGTRREIIAQRQAEVRSAKAREREAQDNLTRIQDLVKQGAFSERQLVEARTAVDDTQGTRLQAEAELAEAQAGPIPEEIAAQRANVAAATAAVNQAQLALDRTVVRAATQGIVQSRTASVGDYVQNAGEIVTLVAGDRLEVFLELPEDLSGRISPGLPITLTARALPQWQERATVTGVAPAADSTSRRQLVRVRLDNPPTTLVSGMAIAGSLQLPSNTPGFVVSRDALTMRNEQWLVFTVENDKAKQIPVEVVADMGEEMAITSPELRAGQAIVLKGGDGLRDGAAVKVVE